MFRTVWYLFCNALIVSVSESLMRYRKRKMRWEIEGHSDRQKTESDGSNG